MAQQQSTLTHSNLDTATSVSPLGHESSPKNDISSTSRGNKTMTTIATPIKLGQVVITPRVQDHLDYLPPCFLESFIERHRRGDWGLVSDDDKALNDDAALNGGQILSVYMLTSIRIWIITEANRSVTTVLLPEEY